MLKEQFLISMQLKHEWIPSFDEYPFSLNAVRNLKVLDFHPSVTFLVGENGSGKSTLLEAIAVAVGLNAEGGSRSFNFDTYSSHSKLHRYLKLTRGIFRPIDSFFLRAESFYNVATEIDRLEVIDAYGGKSLHAQSHGESFITLMMDRFSGNSLYLLDEPEAALSPSRQLTMIARLHQLVQEGTQFVIATHSPIIMAYPNSTIYLLNDDAIQKVDYEETEHYQITKNFINGYSRMLDILMED